MCDECETRERQPIRHQQVIADPQPQYRGPEYYGSTAPVEVDAGLHTLLQVLWAKGFQTQFSCQGWSHGSNGAKRYGTKSYIIFRTAEEGIRFWQTCYELSAAKDKCCPKIVLETCIGLSEDMTYLDEKLPPRAAVRFESVDLPTLEALWTA